MMVLLIVAVLVSAALTYVLTIHYLTWKHAPRLAKIRDDILAKDAKFKADYAKWNKEKKPYDELRFESRAKDRRIAELEEGLNSIQSDPNRQRLTWLLRQTAAFLNVEHQALSFSNGRDVKGVDTEMGEG